MEVGDFEVFAEEFEGEAEEGLVLGLLVEKRWWGSFEVLRTSMRWDSGVSFEVMWSAMVL